MSKFVAVLFISTLSFLKSAEASLHQECRIRILIGSTDNLGNTWKAGSILPVDIERDNPNGGAFCTHGGSCLSRMVGTQPALMLLNCKVGTVLGGGDFRLVPDAGQSGSEAAARLRRIQDITNKLLELGFSSVSSSTLADKFVNHPHSSDGLLAAQTLEGSRSALATLKRNNP